MKTTLGPNRLSIPFPTVLVVTGDMEKANIITIAWISMLTGTPPTLGVSIGNKGYSASQIIKNKDFSVNLASADIMVEADFCGITSGRNIDKFKTTGFTRMPSSFIKSPIINECPVNFECRLIDTQMVGTTNHLIGEIMETHVDDDKLVDTGKLGSLNIVMVNPLIYCSGAREYWKLGEKIGDAYKVGYDLTD